MSFTEFFQSDLFKWGVLPALIFIARIFDVTIGTIRIVAVSKGNKILAPFLGFFEVLVWLLAIGQIMQNLSNPLCYIAYAGGFSLGNYIGIKIEERMALGKFVIRVITQKKADKLINVLRKRGYGVTSLDAEGVEGYVNIILMVAERGDLQDILEKINMYNPNAFYTVEDTRMVKYGIFPQKNLIRRSFALRPLINTRFRFRQWFRGGKKDK